MLLDRARRMRWVDRAGCEARPRGGRAYDESPGRVRAPGGLTMSRPGASRATWSPDAHVEPAAPAAAIAMTRYCVEGDASAFAELYAIAAPRLFGYVLFLVRNRALAEEL